MAVWTSHLGPVKETFASQQSFERTCAQFPIGYVMLPLPGGLRSATPLFHGGMAQFDMSMGAGSKRTREEWK